MCESADAEASACLAAPTTGPKDCNVADSKEGRSRRGTELWGVDSQANNVYRRKRPGDNMQGAVKVRLADGTMVQMKVTEDGSVIMDAQPLLPLGRIVEEGRLMFTWHPDLGPMFAAVDGGEPIMLQVKHFMPFCTQRQADLLMSHMRGAVYGEVASACGVTGVAAASRASTRVLGARRDAFDEIIKEKFIYKGVPNLVARKYNTCPEALDEWDWSADAARGDEEFARMFPSIKRRVSQEERAMLLFIERTMRRKVVTQNKPWWQVVALSGQHRGGGESAERYSTRDHCSPPRVVESDPVASDVHVSWGTPLHTEIAAALRLMVESKQKEMACAAPVGPVLDESGAMHWQYRAGEPTPGEHYLCPTKACGKPDCTMCYVANAKHGRMAVGESALKALGDKIVLHTDLGEVRDKSVEGCRYLMTTIAFGKGLPKQGMLIEAPIVHKDKNTITAEMGRTLAQVRSAVLQSTGKELERWVWHTDREKAFMAKKVTAWVYLNRGEDRRGVSFHHNSNTYAEIARRESMKILRGVFEVSNLPKKFWSYAARFASMERNRSLGIQPRVNECRPMYLGQLGYGKLSRELYPKSKVSPMGTPMALLGYDEPTRAGYVVLFLKEGKDGAHRWAITTVPQKDVRWTKRKAFNKTYVNLREVKTLTKEMFAAEPPPDVSDVEAEHDEPKSHGQQSAGEQSEVELVEQDVDGESEASILTDVHEGKSCLIECPKCQKWRVVSKEQEKILQMLESRHRKTKPRGSGEFAMCPQLGPRWNCEREEEQEVLDAYAEEYREATWPEPATDDATGKLLVDIEVGPLDDEGEEAGASATQTYALVVNSDETVPIAYDPLAHAGSITVPVRTAMSGDASEADAWMEAVQLEVGQLINRQSVRLVPVNEVRPGDEVLPALLVLTLKPHEGRRKARLVCCGNFSHMTPTETFSPTVGREAWMPVLCMMLLLHMRGANEDVEVAYLQSDPIDAEGRQTFMRPPKWSMDEVDRHRFLFQVLNNIYGKRDAGKRWYETFKKWALEEGGYEKCLYDDCIFVNPKTKVVAYLYVDDLFVFALSEKERELAVQQILERFDLRRGSVLAGMDDPLRATFLSAEMYWERMDREQGETCDRFIVSMENYCRSMIAKAGDELVNTPSLNPTFFDLDWLEKGDVLDEKAHKQYRKWVGIVGYPCQFGRPDITTAHAILSQFLAKPTERARKSLWSLLGYVKAHMGRRVAWPIPSEPARKLRLLGMFDSNYGYSKKVRKGHSIFLNDCLVYWRSQRVDHSCLAVSEAELAAGSEASRTLKGIHNLFSEVLTKLGLDIPIEVNLQGDNKAANLVGGNSASIARARHLEQEDLYIREFTQRYVTPMGDETSGRVQYVESSQNFPDCLTKVLTEVKLKKLLDLAGVID